MGLCLTRRVCESVVVRTSKGERLKVTVARIRGGFVRLLFEGDRSVSVAREEIDAAPNVPLVSIGPGGIGHPDSREIGGAA